MKINDSIEEISKTIPESFYDALAYIIPGTFLIVIPIFIISDYRSFMEQFYNTDSAVFDKTIIIGFSLFSAYVVGQVLTSLSWYSIGILGGYFCKIFKINSWVYKKNRNWTPFDKNFDRDWTQDYIYIRNKNAQIGLEVTKRYARYILSRNSVLVGIVLVFFSIVFNDKTIVIGIIFIIIFFFDAYSRRCWFLTYIEETSKKLKETK